MITITPKILEAGRNLLLRAVAGEKITFTRFEIGNGEVGEGVDVDLLENLCNPLVTFSINEIDNSKKGFVKVTGAFDSTYIQGAFRWRELGLFCQGEDGNERLFAYSNDGDSAGMLKANATDVIAENNISLIIAIGEAENVTAILAESLLYASKESFEKHIGDYENPHKVTKEQLELENVENVAPNDQKITYTVVTEPEELVSGEKMSTSFGKLASAVKNLIAHLSNIKNPHRVTAKQIEAAEKEHTHNAADMTSGILGISRGGTGVSTKEELRELLESRIYIGRYSGPNVRKQIDYNEGYNELELPFKPKFVYIVGVHDQGLGSVSTGLITGATVPYTVYAGGYEPWVYGQYHALGGRLRLLWLYLDGVWRLRWNEYIDNYGNLGSDSSLDVENPTNILAKNGNEYIYLVVG